jgi:mono/diheme cytochrome c family protein
MAEAVPEHVMRRFAHKPFTNLPALLAASGMLAFGVLAPGSVAFAGTGDTDPGVIDQGKAVFQRVCAPCHGAGPGLDGAKMLPGAAAIAAKYKGTVPPLLEQRGDLTADYLKYFVRHGSGAMPMFRKTEITDAEIDAVAAYLKDAAARNPPEALR